jgi:hypothetical protein
MRAAEHADHATHSEGRLPRAARWLSRLIPAGDREAIVGDLLEDAEFRGIAGARRDLWLLGECGTIAAGLSVARARAWLVLPPVRELAAGLALDGTRAFRGGNPIASVVRAVVFCGSVATLVLGVELLVGSLLSAAGL